MSEDRKLIVAVRERGGRVFEGQVFSVSSINELGPFDVLWGHANMVTTIQNRLILRVDKDRAKIYEIESGILSAENNRVEVLLGI